MTRAHRIAAGLGLALGFAGIGFAIGRATAAGAYSGSSRESDGRVATGDAAAASRHDALPTQGLDSTRTPPESDTVVEHTSAGGTARRARRSDADRPVVDAGAPAATAAAGVAPEGRRRVMLGDLDLTAIGHDRGDPDAPLVLIEFSDFGCPYCAEFARETYPAIEREYIRTGRVYFKYVPFLAGFASGREATRAAECAADQGKFWTMTDAIYESQGVWQKAWDAHAELRRLAGAAGLDTAAYWSCYAVHRPDARTRRATDAAERAGVRVTPSFMLNGRPVEGALPQSEFRRLIDEGLLMEEARRAAH